MRDRIKVEVPHPRVHLVQWNGVETGDVLEVEDANGRSVQGNWIFRSAVCMPGTRTVDHIEFLYTRGKHGPMLRSIFPDRVRIPTEKALLKQRESRRLLMEMS